MFFHRLLDYRKAEVESLAQLFLDDKDKWSSLEWRIPLHHHPDSPFHYVNLPSEDAARNIANRSTHHPLTMSLSLSLSCLFVFVFCFLFFVFLFLLVLVLQFSICFYNYILPCWGLVNCRYTCEGYI